MDASGKANAVKAVPTLPVLDIEQAVEFYESKLGFIRVHAAEDYGIVQRNDVEIHVWAANEPDTPGAEPHLAGSASCRVQVEGLRELLAEYRDRQVISPDKGVDRQPWGTEELPVLDKDRNLITFYEQVG
jgi:catechol 2,3-dioxygenase-like lactoylglutathione lyase family enzyme